MPVVEDPSALEEGASQRNTHEGERNGLTVVDTKIDSRMDSRMRDECSSQASLPSAPVSAAVSAAASSADLHAQDVAGLEEERGGDGEDKIEHSVLGKNDQDGMNESEGEGDSALDGPSHKRSRHE